MKKRPSRNILSKFNRRQAIGFLSGTAIVSLFGCLRGQSTAIGSQLGDSAARTMLGTKSFKTGAIAFSIAWLNFLGN